MNYEIEFKMIEIKDLSKIQKRELVKDEFFEADVEQVEDVADDYCQGIMARVELVGECKQQDAVEEQLLFTIIGRSGKKLEIYGIIDIDDSEGTASVMQIRVYNADEDIINGDIGYMNGEAEYNPIIRNRQAICL